MVSAKLKFGLAILITWLLSIFTFITVLNYKVKEYDKMLPNTASSPCCAVKYTRLMQHSMSFTDKRVTQWDRTL